MKFPLIFLCIIFLNLLFFHTSSSEENKKVKCKEHIDAALKQYWDHEKDSISISNENIQNLVDETEENDEDSDEKLDVKVMKETIKNKDEDDDNDEDEDDDEKTDEDSSKKNDTKLNKKEELKKDSDKNLKENDDEEDDDDDDDDDDENKNDNNDNDSDEKIEAKKSKKNDSDDDDDGDSEEKENLKKKTEAVDKKSTRAVKNESEEVDDIEKKQIIKNEKKTSKNDEKDDDKKEDDDSKDDDENDDDENEDDDSEEIRSRDYIQEILRLEEIGSVSDKEEQSLIQNIFKDLKKIYESAIKPLEILFKYRSITNRLISDSEIFAKPLVLFIGGKSSGKTTLINYLLGLQKTPWEFPTGQPVSHSHFTVIGYGPEYTKLTPMEFSADIQFSNLQQFGENFLEQRIQAYKMPLDVLERMTIIDTASIVEQVKNVKSQETDIFQWFFDRSDVIYMTLDLKQLTITSQMKTILEQLKGRDIRFVLTKADTMKHSQLILSIGQLFWILSPLIAADRPPKVYALTTQPLSDYDMFLDEQEQLWLTDLSEQVLSVSRIESRIASVRRHAVRVRNHAKLVDCYLNTYYKHKGLFTFGESAKKLATEITQNPQEFNIFSNGIALDSNKYNQLSTINSNINIENNFNLNNINKKIANEAMQNISRYDLPDADVYKAFFSVHTLLDFKPLSSTCSFFKGCPIDKLDVAIAYQLPDLVSKYKKLTKLTLN